MGGREKGRNLLVKIDVERPENEVSQKGVRIGVPRGHPSSKVRRVADDGVPLDPLDAMPPVRRGKEPAVERPVVPPLALGLAKLAKLAKF